MQVIETKPKTNNMSKDTWIRAYKQFNEIANPQKTLQIPAHEKGLVLLLDSYPLLH